MNNPTGTLCHSTDELLEQVLEEITARIQAGELVDLDACVAEHPEYAERLEQLLPAMQILVAFGASQSVTVVGPSASESIPAASGVLGDFRIIHELGRGGMGVVYEAEQISIGRPVALKVLPFASMLDERRLARFRNEVRAAGQLHHTHIVPIYAVGADRGVHYYAMQLVVGHTLAEVICDLRQHPHGLYNPSEKTSAPIAPSAETDRAALSTLPLSGSSSFYRSVAQIGQQAAEALEHAHACGVVHRDIKPSNLLLDGRNNLWLTDFGLASVEAISDLTMSGELLGTLRYMSPEQALGSRVVLDHRTDIYSLGATLYELLTLEPAFDAAERGELLRQIAVVEPSAPRRIAPTIPADLETIILKAMAKDASSRYATAQNLADDLRRFLENRPIQARRPSLVERGRKWITRHAALVATAAVAMAVVAIIGTAAMVMTLRAYRAENKQRAAAEANLEVASQIIDRMLTRVADDQYYQGDLQHAEELASNASEYYEELLGHSDDADLQFRAAQAYSNVSHIWWLISRHEKAGIASRRAGELLQHLTTSYPGNPQYLVALARNYNQIGLVDWSLDRPLAAEPSFRQAWEIFAELNEQSPSDRTYQSGLAMMLANLGSVCYLSDRFNEAEEYYRRAEAIATHLPPDMQNTAEGLASQAGSCTNRAELARLRGHYDEALSLLDQSIPLHKQSLAKWPTNPVALDCYFHTLWNIGECHLGAGRPVEAAAAVERLVATFPNRLASYHEGVEQLLRCAVQADVTSGWPLAAAFMWCNQGAVDAMLQLGLVTDATAYRQRAHELVQKASDAPQWTADTTNAFAWFLLTCEDKTFRDPHKALSLAKQTVKDVPERADAWLTLALADYRDGDCTSADSAVQNSIKFARDDETKASNWLLLSMIRGRDGRRVEARQLRDKADELITRNKGLNKDLLVLRGEADSL